ncbi:hypothetical protein J2Z49_000571 [Desulfofundulus luciae]|uniref:Uncharacterized protein n=1 Tax=Desulfofundulus luciae TaxID=74702 RepID=A0ABU0AYA8_9FIRM|nr:hypothetical protein [Desulfofundulus luciae]
MTSFLHLLYLWLDHGIDTCLLHQAAK